MKQKFNVAGMTCTACSNSIEKNVKKMRGVTSANVNLINNFLIVDYDETKTTNDEIIKTVNSLGYSASLPNEQNKSNSKTINVSLKFRFLLSLIFLIPLMIISMGHMLGLPLPKFFSPNYSPANFVLIQLVLTTPVLIINFQFFISGTRAVMHKSPNMDTLVMLGSLSAYVYSFVLLFIINFNVSNGNLSLASNLAMNTFFESTAMILTLVTLGKWLEEKSKGKTKEEITKLIKLKPNNAVIELDGTEHFIDTKDIKIGNIIIIKPGDFVPCDGTVIEGNSSLNKSAITGESLPIEVKVGDFVTSASINLTGYLKIKAEKVGSETMLEKIIKLMEDSGNNKAPIAKIADKVSAVFVPIVVIISILTLIIWLIISKNFGYSLNLAISVLVISCPCALGLATPVAIMVGTGVGSKNGILFKDGTALEKLSHVKNVVFDKTATITEGKLSVKNVYSNVIENNLLIQIAVSLEKISSHPLSECIVEYGKENGVKNLKVSNYEYLIGMGIKGKINGKNYLLGNSKLLREFSINITETNEIPNTSSPIYLANLDNKQYLGCIIVEDKIKPTSTAAIEKLNKKYINTYMLSGDNKIVANSVAEQVGIKNVYSEVMPEDKLNIVSNLQTSNLTAFVGDGINDAPALKQADIGIAIGNGTDVAIEAADVVLVNNNLLDVVTAIELSKSTLTNIKENLFWAFFYNTIGIPIAAGLLVPVGIILNPMIASLAMSLSSLFVVGNALRLRLFKNKNKGVVNDMQIKIEGMSCDHCKQHVETALNVLEGVTATVNLKKKCAYLTNQKNLPNETLIQAIVNAGYSVKSIKKD